MNSHVTTNGYAHTTLLVQTDFAADNKTLPMFIAEREEPSIFFHQKSLEGLGCFSYMIGSYQTGECAVIDPQRDIADYIEIAQAHGLSITYLIETHVHADHVSGCQELAACTGAPIYIHERAEVCYPHTPLKAGDHLMLGECRIEVLYTPGHTLDSICLLVTDMSCGEQPTCLLAGDTLMVGDLGRPDLAPGTVATDMAALLYASVHDQLMALPDDLPVYPGHGAGSLCARNPQAGRSTTIGNERRANEALRARSCDDFVRQATANLSEQPANFRRIKQLNSQGARVLGSDMAPKALDPIVAADLLGQGHVLVDIRSLRDFARGHAPNALNLPIGDSQFASRAGQRLPAGVTIVLIDDDIPDALPDDTSSVDKAARALASVGYDCVAGYVEGGISAWQQAGLPVVAIALHQAAPSQIAELLACGEHALQLIDVREPWEWSRGHLPGAVHIPLGQLERHAHEVDPCRPVIAYCRAGSRSQSAAAILAELGCQTVYNLAGGIEAWQRSGYSVITS